MPTFETGDVPASFQTGDVAAPKTAFQKQALSRKLGIQTEQAAATQGQDISNAWAKFGGDISKTIPVAATLATGGLAAPLAIGAMGAASGVAGAYDQAVKLALGATDTSGYSGLTGLGPKNAPSGAAVDSPKQLARRLGVDVALGAGLQGAAEFGSVLLKHAGESVLQPMVAKAAAKMDQGKAVLNTYGVKLLNKLRSVDAAAGTPKISIQPELDNLEAALAARKTGPSDGFTNLWGGAPFWTLREGANAGSGSALSPGQGGLAKKIYVWAQTDGSASGLTEIKGELSQAAFKRAGLNFEERTALQTFAEKVDNKLSSSFKQLGGDEAKQLYDGYKGTIDQLHRFNAGADMSGLALRHMAWRAGYLTAGAGFGGYEGSKRGGGVAGAIKGAVIGAATITAAEAALQKGAPLLLARLLADKTTAPMTKQAINTMANGDTKEAMAIFTRAVAQSGISKHLGPYLKSIAEQSAPQEAPNAASTGQK